MSKSHEKDDYFSKLLLSNKELLWYLMKHCVEEYKDLSKEEIIKLIEDGIVNNGRIKDINTEDLGLNDSKVVYDILYTSKLPNSNERIGLYFNRVLEREAPTSNKQSLLSGGSESLQYP